ncbi:hypothetical protein BDP81DRAFT_415817 [Colletotrichum phormii]|uniref:Secreted protein n=1 Tax=Colletotrichum phormii TaxID=359342 RepID=A0AAJ0EJV6_9PEZI|nr:uncharacterized protein BDP81DRAFT_415817 [Colletotrichum phormii]KAK1654481.1 hypothetical protein BDP81DRAFT_415817 [Colletotrichum phormii]
MQRALLVAFLQLLSVRSLSATKKVLNLELSVCLLMITESSSVRLQFGCTAQQLVIKGMGSRAHSAFVGVGKIPSNPARQTAYAACLRQRPMSHTHLTWEKSEGQGQSYP